MADKNVRVCYGIDLDAVAGWLGSYEGQDSPDDISRGVWAGQVGTPNLLDLFKRYNIKTTWFIPGQSIETFPNECKRIVDEGHEVGLHGYSHENPIVMSPEQEEKVLVHTINICTGLTGKKPVGYRAPWWEFSKVTNDLLIKHGIKYDSSLMHRDFEAYYVRTGDQWYSIDYTKDPETWMKPMEFGVETDLIEIPANWYLDDLPPTMFIKKYPNSFGWVSPDVLFDMWKAQFDFLYRKGEGVFPITIHPDTSGRPQMIIMLHERLIPYIMGHPGSTFCTYEEYATEWKTKHPRRK
jgi:peptidoglycan/xylan/chitin deacetylase (PgdA/CDA1 family)